MAITTAQDRALTHGGGYVISVEGTTLGRIGQLYRDPATDEPMWVTARMGWFGLSESFVPLASATVQGHDVAVNYRSQSITTAPRTERDGVLSPHERRRLCHHYTLQQDKPEDPLQP